MRKHCKMFSSESFLLKNRVIITHAILLLEQEIFSDEEKTNLLQLSKCYKEEN